MRKSIFGRTATISHDSKVYTLSLVKWGFFRKRTAKITKASPFMFIPSYDLAIYDGKAGGINYNNPCFLFHFDDRKMAVSRMKWAEEKIESEGMLSFRNNLSEATFDPKREGIYIDYYRDLFL